MIAAGCLCPARPRTGALILLSLLLAAAPAGAQPAGAPPAAESAAAVATEAAGTATLLGSLSPEAGLARSVEAQVAYRNGREAQKRGQVDVARRHFAEAIRIEPHFADPWFAMAGSRLPFRPDQAVSEVVSGVRACWRTFRGQHRLVLNVSLLALAIVSLTVLATAGLVVFRALRHFQHPIFEVIRKRLPAAGAALAAWAIVVQPVLWFLGLFLLLVFAAGNLWFHMNRGERKIAVALVALSVLVPLSMQGLSRLASPLNPDSIPYLLSAASESPDQPGLRSALSRAMSADPDDPNPHMALGLVHEKAGQWGLAEQEYRQALALNGDMGRLHNNLGNILNRSGRFDEAIQEYQAAIEAAPPLAAPHFNLSQLYARRLQFDLADASMKRAGQLDFEGMRATLAGRARDQGELMSLGLSPADLWEATLASRAGFSLGLPAGLGWVYGGPLGLLPVLSLVLFGLGLLVGRSLYRFLPTYSCANCDAVVCRKCLRRIRRKAYCASCGDTILSMQTSEFTRMLLERRLKEEGWLPRLARTILMILVPGWEAIRRGRPLVGMTVMGAFMALLLPVMVNGQPVKAVPALTDAGPGGTWSLLVFGLLALYGMSALLLRILPEPESALMGQDMSVVSGRAERLDRAA